MTKTQSGQLAEMRRTPPDLARLNQTRARVSQKPETGSARFQTVTEWTSGAQAVTRARAFSVNTDEPVDLGGTDAAMDPMELLMAAFGSCLTIGWTKQAELRGIKLRSLSITVDAPFNLKGHLDLDDTVRPGFEELVYDVQVDCDCEDTELEEIRIAAEKTSGLFDNILNVTPVAGRIDRSRPDPI